MSFTKTAPYESIFTALTYRSALPLKPKKPFGHCSTLVSFPKKRQRRGLLVPESYDQSALRHFEDAETLTSDGRFDGAGHLLGFAVECAIKHAVMSLRPSMDAPHVHLPQLVEKAKKTIQGRRKHSIHRLLERPNFMAGWDVSHRYSADGTIDEVQLRAWRDDASRTISAAGLRRNSR